MSEELIGLYEDLIYLDEIAGELDPETNARIDQQRAELKAKIIELRSMVDSL
jgi:ABC-type phosphate transport system ATPase subunit